MNVLTTTQYKFHYMLHRCDTLNSKFRECIIINNWTFPKKKKKTMNKHTQEEEMHFIMHILFNERYTDRRYDSSVLKSRNIPIFSFFKIK